MKNLKYLFIGVLTLCSFLMNGQSAALNVALKFQIGNPGSTGTYPTFTMSGFVSDDLGRWDASSVQVGDSLYAINGSDLAVCVVTTINSAAGNSLNITVTCGDPLVGGIDAGQAAIVHPTSEYKFPTYISGLRDDLRSMIMNRLTQRVDASIRNAQEIAFTSGTGVPNSTVATSLGYRLAKNNGGDGDLYEWNGTAWAISGGSSFQPCTDTINTTGITPTLVLGSGMVRVSGGWDNISGFLPTVAPDGVVISISGSTAVIATCGSFPISLSAGNYYADSMNTSGFTTTTPTGNIRPLGHVTEGVFTVSSLGTIFQGGASSSGASSVSVTSRLSGNGTSGSPLDIAQQGATSGQTLKWNGTTWLPANDNVGSVTTNNLTGTARTTITNGTGAVLGASAVTVDVNESGLNPTNISITDGGNYFTTDNVNAALQQLGSNSHASATILDGTTIDLTLSGQQITAEVKTNSLDSTHIKVGGLELEGLSKDGAVIGQTIKWDGTSWKPQNDLDNQTATTVAATATSPLTGITVQAQLNELATNTHAPVTVTDNAKIDFTLTGQNITASVVNNSIDSLQIKDGTVRLLELNQSGATTGQVPVWDGSNWVSNTISSNKTEYCTDTITQSSHGFTEGTPIRYNGTSWVTTIGAYGNTISATGVVVKSISSNQFVVANCGSFPTVIASGSYYQIDASPGYGVVPDTLQVPLFKIEAGQMFVNPVFGITTGETLNFVDGSSVDFTKSGSNITSEITGFNAATNGYVPSKNGTSISWVALGGLPLGTDAQTLRYNGTTLEASSNIINNGTKVGIGGPVDATSKLSITGGVLTDDIRMVTNAYQSWVGGGRFRWNTHSFGFSDVNFNGYSTLSTTGGVPNIFSRTSTGFTQGTGTIGNFNYLGTIYLLQNADNYGNGFVNARYTSGGNRFAWSNWQGSDSTYIFSSMSFPITNLVTGLTNRFGFKASGQFMLYNYTSPTSFTGTVVADLGVTSTGAVVTKSPTVASVMREESFTATAAQTAFTIAYSAPSVSGTSVPIRVYRNGVRLFYVTSGPTSTQFTYTGTTVTTSANLVGDIITVEYLN